MSLPRLFVDQVRGQITNPARARALLEQIGPAVMQMGQRGSDLVRRAAVKAGLVDDVTAFPSVVSQQRSLGLVGERPSVPMRPPSATPERMRGFVGRADQSALRPEMQRIVEAAAQRRAAAEAARTPSPGVRDLSSLPQPRPAAPASRPAQLAAPNPPVSAGPIPQTQEVYLQRTLLKPGEGEIGSTARLRFPAGTVGTDGRKLGNVTYEPGLEAGLIQGPNLPSTGRNVAELIEEGMSTPRGPIPGEALGRSMFREPEPFTGAIELSPNLVREVQAINAARVAPRPAFGPNAGPAPVDALIDRAFGLRNAAGGVQMGDLAQMLAIGSAGIGGAGLAGIGLSAMFGRPDEGSAPVGEYPSTVVSPPGVPPVSPGGLNTPGVMFREPDGSPLGAQPNVPSYVAPRRIDPTAPAPVMTPGRDRESDRRAQLSQYAPSAAAIDRAVEPRSPETYRNIGEYYAAREAYATQAPVRQSLMKYVEGTATGPAEAAQLQKWAAQYPVLAYEMQRRSLANPAASQQTAESVTTTTVTTPMGSQTSANAVGNAEATAASAVNPTQGNADLRAATTPQQQPQLQRAQEFIERMGIRSRMYGGY